VPDDGSLACYTNTFIPTVVRPSGQEYLNPSPSVVSTIYPSAHLGNDFYGNGLTDATVCIRFKVLPSSTGWTEADAAAWPLITDGKQLAQLQLQLMDSMSCRTSECGSSNQAWSKCASIASSCWPIRLNRHPVCYAISYDTG
jgi:hypothetical protein